MSNQTQEALKMAIEWIEGWYGDNMSRDAVLNACKEALEQPTQEPSYIYDLEAIAWALDKLSKFGVANNSSDNALMADRLQMMLYQAPLEQPAQEPNCYGDGNVYRGLRSEDSKVKTYHVNTHPHQWQGLTDDEIQNILTPIVLLDNADSVTDYEIARAIEQALKEKNHGA